MQTKSTARLASRLVSSTVFSGLRSSFYDNDLRALAWVVERMPQDAHDGIRLYCFPSQGAAFGLNIEHVRPAFQHDRASQAVRQGLCHRNPLGRGRVPVFLLVFRVFGSCLGVPGRFLCHPGPILEFVFLWRCLCRQSPPCRAVVHTSVLLRGTRGT